MRRKAPSVVPVPPEGTVPTEGTKDGAKRCAVRHQVWCQCREGTKDGAKECAVRHQLWCQCHEGTKDGAKECAVMHQVWLPD
jgi:hypothetical protein